MLWILSRDKLLSAEKSLRQNLEAELAEKTEQLYKERVSSMHGDNGRYSPNPMLSSFGSDTSFREELSAAQRLNLQVKILEYCCFSYESFPYSFYIIFPSFFHNFTIGVKNCHCVEHVQGGLMLSHDWHPGSGWVPATGCKTCYFKVWVVYFMQEKGKVRQWKPQISYSTWLPSHLFLHPSCVL